MAEEDLIKYWKNAKCKYYDSVNGYCNHEEAEWVYCDYTDNNIRNCMLSSKLKEGESNKTKAS